MTDFERMYEEEEKKKKKAYSYSWVSYCTSTVSVSWLMFQDNLYDSNMFIDY